MAEGVGFEPTREQNPLPVFKTGALNHSATLPREQLQVLKAYNSTNANIAIGLDPNWTQTPISTRPWIACR
jgi:hypothetical protein